MRTLATAVPLVAMANTLLTPAMVVRTTLLAVVLLSPLLINSVVVLPLLLLAGRILVVEVHGKLLTLLSDIHWRQVFNSVMVLPQMI
jgi:hypothetical protein